MKFTLNEPGVVVLQLAKRKIGRKVKRRCVAAGRRKIKRSKRCTRFVKLSRRYTIRATRGLNLARLTNRASGRTLKPGRYYVSSATIDGVPQKFSPISFRIVK